MSSPAMNGQADDSTWTPRTSATSVPVAIDASSQQQIIVVTAFTVLTVGGFVVLMGIARWWFRRAGVEEDINEESEHRSPRPWARASERFLSVTEMRRLRTLVSIAKPSVTDLKLKYARNEETLHWKKIQPLCAQIDHSECEHHHKKPPRRSSLDQEETPKTPSADSIMVGAIIMMPTRKPAAGDPPVCRLPMVLGTSQVA